jgi:hypothetical protein
VAGFFARFGPVWALRFLAFLQRGLAGLVVVRAVGEPGGRFYGYEATFEGLAGVDEEARLVMANSGG